MKPTTSTLISLKTFFALLLLALATGSAWFILDRQDTTWFVRDFANEQQRHDGLAVIAHETGQLTPADNAAVEKSLRPPLDRPSPTFRNLALFGFMAFSCSFFYVALRLAKASHMAHDSLTDETA